MSDTREQFVLDKLASGGLNEHDRAQFMAELEQIEESKRQSEAIFTEVADGITSSMESFSVGDIIFTLEQLAVDGDAVNILRRGLQATSKAQAQKFLDELNNQKSTYEMNVALKQGQVNILVAERDELQSANAQLQLEKDDLAEKRDAAAQQLLEAQAEIARLNSHVDDLRKEIAVGATNAHSVIDITSEADLEAAAKRLRAKQEQEAAAKRAAAEAAKIPVYDVKELFRSNDGTYTTFKIAATGEPGEIIWTEFNSLYRKMDEAEVERFRAELEANKADVPEIAEPVESNLVVEESTIPVPTFREPEDTGRELGGHAVEAEVVPDVAGGVVTETFEQEMRRRVGLLESHAFGELQMVS